MMKALLEPKEGTHDHPENSPRLLGSRPTNGRLLDMLGTARLTGTVIQSSNQLAVFKHDEGRRILARLLW